MTSGLCHRSTRAARNGPGCVPTKLSLQIQAVGQGQTGPADGGFPFPALDQYVSNKSVVGSPEHRLQFIVSEKGPESEFPTCFWVMLMLFHCPHFEKHLSRLPGKTWCTRRIDSSRRTVIDFLFRDNICQTPNVCQRMCEAFPHTSNGIIHPVVQARSRGSVL